MILPVCTKLLNPLLRDIVPLFLALAMAVDDVLYPAVFYFLKKWKIVILWYNGVTGIVLSFILAILMITSFRSRIMQKEK